MLGVLNSKFFHMIWVLRVLFEHICYTNCCLNSDSEQDMYIHWARCIGIVIFATGVWIKLCWVFLIQSLLI